jgi:hypothetical protein
MPNAQITHVTVFDATADDIEVWHQYFHSEEYESHQTGGFRVGGVTVRVDTRDYTLTLEQLGQELINMSAKLRKGGLDMIAEANSRSERRARDDVAQVNEALEGPTGARRITVKELS